MIYFWIIPVLLAAILIAALFLRRLKDDTVEAPQAGGRAEGLPPRAEPPSTPVDEPTPPKGMRE